MFGSLRTRWHEFLRHRPGHRFKSFYEERRKNRGHQGGGRRKWVTILVGMLIAVGGVFLLPLPGPGSIVLVAGLVLVSTESLTMARVLDAADKKRAKAMSTLRRLWRGSRRTRGWVIGSAAGVVLLAAGGVAWWWMRA